ncbi:hypothetical protein Mapa_013739 [Marchantia paleacea]|nr:hypothetical protein Mapa_013739 [Marchantia paleacea]
MCQSISYMEDIVRRWLWLRDLHSHYKVTSKIPVHVAHGSHMSERSRRHSTVATGQRCGSICGADLEHGCCLCLCSSYRLLVSIT